MKIIFGGRRLRPEAQPEGSTVGSLFSEKGAKMSLNRFWEAYPATYRAKEMKTLAGWISAGESGSVVGLLGSGRSNLLGFLCYRPEVIQTYLPPEADLAAVISVDLNNLPDSTLSALYRVIIRSFYRVRYQFDQKLQEKIVEAYRESRAEQDSFLSQSTLQELILHFQAQQMRVILVLNRFDHFCQMATPQMVNTLRGLRDEFKDTINYIAGMTQEVAYMPDPAALGEMYELLDNYICWVGAMDNEDAQNLISRATGAASEPPTDMDIRTMIALSGGYPSLLRTTCNWWLITEDKPAHLCWIEALLAERSIQHRLGQIWQGLTQEEQFVLSGLQKLQARATGAALKGRTANNKPKNFNKMYRDFTKEHYEILAGLSTKGLLHQTEIGWQIKADLLAAYVAKVEGRGRGRVWLDEKTGEIYQGETLLKDLTTLEKSVLSFLIKHPRICHTKTDLIVNTWPDELRQHGVTDSSLYQLISTLRKQIEPNPSEPSYLINWRGKPEGGYQFFPEGRPK